MNVFFPNNEVRNIQLMNGVLVALVVTLATFDRIGAIQMAALVATTILATTLIPARLLGVPRLARVQGELLSVARNGKWLGIWTCLWWVLYAALALPEYYGAKLGVATMLGREVILLTLSLLVFVGLLCLSNKWSYAHVKWWKQINMMIWLVVPFLFTHLLLSAQTFGNEGAFWAPAVIFALTTLAGLSGVARDKRDYFAFHRLVLIAVGILVSVFVVLFYPTLG